MKKERSKKHRLLQILRILSQAAFFGLFLWLFFGTHFTGQDYIGNVEGMFHFDPLLAVVTFIAADGTSDITAAECERLMV